MFGRVNAHLMHILGPMAETKPAIWPLLSFAIICLKERKAQ